MQRIPSFLMIVLAFPPRVAAALSIAVWLFIVGVLFIVEHQLEDLANDQRFGVRTWATARGRLRTQRTRFRLYRIYGWVSVAAAAVVFWETTTWAGLFSGLLLMSFSSLLRFLAWGRYVGNRSLPRPADLPPTPGKDRVVIHGGGLSGLMAAIKLADWGYEVEVREKMPAGDHREQSSTVHAVRFDPAYLEEYLECPVGDCFESVHRETIYVNGRPLRRNSRHWVCRRGRSPDTLDGRLTEFARHRGVIFVHVGGVRESSSGPTILATGLSTASFETLDLDHTRLSGYWAAAPCSRPNVLLTYVGNYAHPNYGYVASVDGTLYALLFSRRGTTPEALEIFKCQLEATEGITFDTWRTMRGAVPREVHLFRSGYVLAGTLGGVMDPFWYSGVSGALVSGGLAALAHVDPELAQMEHRYVTRNFRVQLWLSDVAARLPWRWALVPWIVNGIIDPAGSLGRWCRKPRTRERVEPLEPPAVELQHQKAGIGD
jgi:flavin-dependent dehydrogenase